MKNILSLFDHSGNWVRNYGLNGYKVYTVDIKNAYHEDMFPNRTHIVHDLTTPFFPDFEVHGLIMQPPCTHFSLSGTRHFFDKDVDGRTREAIQLVHSCLETLRDVEPMFWVLENPRSRIQTMVPELGKPRFKFQPYEFGGYVDPPENHRKMTWLWGDFHIPAKKPVPPEPDDKRRLNRVGGTSEKTKEFRAETPKGFALAFYRENK